MFLAIWSFIIWLIFFVLNLMLAYALAKSVQQGIERILNNDIGSEELLVDDRRNRMIPYLISMSSIFARGSSN
jgi:hypothetical protein